jgi:hypothetical protein
MCSTCFLVLAEFVASVLILQSAVSPLLENVAEPSEQTARRSRVAAGGGRASSTSTEPIKGTPEQRPQFRRTRQRKRRDQAAYAQGRKSGAPRAGRDIRQQLAQRKKMQPEPGDCDEIQQIAMEYLQSTDYVREEQVLQSQLEQIQDTCAKKLESYRQAQEREIENLVRCGTTFKKSNLLVDRLFEH